ncbi:colicin E3/pyocin S6 family cytotoxin [Synechococcus sp. PCC 6312]|uniref:colicin E3/pyocin S6 family cytotoxin n=1 Tax=Synechococcus sp. (strain ATCC 27167 / PCC 6312) TaxID=195253 RepID=UPI000A011797|nr:colicin E3/pyocin S6 family cytotoxin [Synechococcus sp. PCC 6312]
MWGAAGEALEGICRILRIPLPQVPGFPENPAEGLVPPFVESSIGSSSEPILPPKNLPAFPDTQRVKPKTSVQGGGHLRKRWKDDKGNIYEWDYQHGTVEKYDKKGKHQGEFDPITGEQTKPADNNRRVEP